MGNYNLFDTTVYNYNSGRGLVTPSEIASGLQIPSGLPEADAPVDVSFSQTLGASLGYSYSPIIDYLSNLTYTEEDRDQNYNPFDDMEGFAGHEDYLKDAVNEEHMNVLKDQLRENMKRRKILQNSSIGSQIVAGIFDPINLIALPFGGLGKGVLSASFRTGAGVGAISTLAEGARFPFDPLATKEEVIGNIAIATVGGAILGGAIAGANKLRVKAAQKQIEKEIKDFNNLADTIQSVNKARDNVDLKIRPKGKAGQEELVAEQKQLPNTLDELRAKKESLEQDKTLLTEDEAVSARQTLFENRKTLARRKRIIQNLVFQNKRHTKKAQNIVKFLEDIKLTRDKYAEGLLKIKEELLAQFRGQRGFNIGLSKKQIAFLKRIEQQEKAYFLSKKQTALIKKRIQDVEKAQKIIDQNTAKLRKKYEGTDDLISQERVNEIRNENAKLEKDLGKVSAVSTMRKQEVRLLKEIKEIDTELSIRRTEDEALLDADGVPVDKYKLEPNWYTNNFVYKALVTPMKKVFQSELPLAIKRNFSKLANDAGLTQVAAKLGDTLGMSVYTRAAVRNGEYVKAHDALRQLYSEHTGKNRNIIDIDFQKKGYHQWLEDTYTRILKQEPLSDLDKKVKSIVDGFMTTWEKRLREQGVIGTTENIRTRITQENIRLQNYATKLREVLEDPKGKRLKINDVAEELEKEIIAFTRGEIKELNIGKRLDELEKYRIGGFYKQRTNNYKNETVIAEIRRIQDDLKMLKENLEVAKTTKVKPNNEEFFFPRYWDITAIKANRADFERILTEWYINNPTILTKNKQGYMERTEALTPDEIIKATDPTRVAKRVKDTVDTIIKERQDITDDAMAFYGHGKSKHFRHRTLDIPNKLVTSYIIKNPVQVMRVYTQRVAGRYEFAKQFNGRTVDQVLADMDTDMYKAGASFKQMNEVRKDFLHMYDRVVGRVITNPDRFDQKVITIMRDLAQLNYLGSAGFSTLPDLAKVLMEHDLGNVMKGLTGLLSDSRVKLNAKEGRLAGEILEILQGDTHLRFVEDLTNNPLATGYELALSKTRNAFYILNGLAPMTNLMKRLDSVIRTHELIQFSVADAKGVAKQADIEYLRRYNIDKKMAKEISKLVDDGVIQNTKENGSGVYLGNTEKWLENGVAEETLDTFRGGLNNGIMNTILMGTPADKPIIADGVVYIPEWIGSKFGLKADKRYRGYSRIETGLAGLPFQFWSYSFAAANKITAAMATGQAKNRAAAFTTAIGLGYLSLEVKSQFGSPFAEYNWDRLSFEDKLARSIDASGLLAMYSDLFYTSMHTSLALGGPDISMGLLEPKFPQDQSVADAITSVGGAGPAITVDIVRGLHDFAIEGKYGRGSAQVIKNLPFMRLWFIKGSVSELSSVLVDLEDDGFDRTMRSRF